MISPRAAALGCLLAVAPYLATGQAPETASERARLANQRIQAEAERRAREELELRKRASDLPSEPAGAQPQSIAPNATAGRAEPTQPPASRPSASAPPVSGSPLPGPATDDERTTRALRQLRELGELKDAGYVTDEEFQRIKQRILERQF